jgi:hypothetical protein
MCVGASIASGKDIRLEVDGGIKVDNIRRVADAGADTFVAGSAIFGKPDYKAVVDAMRAALWTSQRAIDKLVVKLGQIQCHRRRRVRAGGQRRATGRN